MSLGGATRTRHPSSCSGSARRAPTLLIVGQTSARFVSIATLASDGEYPGGGVNTRPGNVSCRMLHCSCCGATRQHFHAFEQMNRSVISECCCRKNTQLKSFHSLIFRHWKIMISLISDVHNIMRDSLMCKTTHARASQAQLNTTLRSEIGMEGNRQIVLSSRWHS